MMMMDRRGDLMMAFAKGAQKLGSSLQLLEAICAECPELKKQPCLPASAGYMGHVILFPDVVAKAPRGEAAFGAYDREHRIMRMLNDAGVDKVPQLLHVGEKTHFFTQERKAGVMLEPALFSGFSEADMRSLAREIAGFIRDVAAAGKPQKLAAIDFYMSQPKAAELAKALAKPHLRALLGQDFDYVRGCAEAYGAAEKRPPMFMHSDLAPTNILVNPGTPPKLAAVIDYGLCEYAPPERAFGAIYKGFGANFADMIAESWGEISGQKVSRQDVYLCMLTHSLHILSRYPDGDPKETGAAHWLDLTRFWADKLRTSGYAPQGRNDPGEPAAGL
jgi:hypothetical protein